MAQLAIKGCVTRGEEVIEILEILGGENYSEYNGKSGMMCYYIDKNGHIECDKDEEITFPVHILTIDEFIEKFPYKVGDRVRVADCESEVRIDSMSWDGREIQYQVFTDETEWYSAEELNKYNEINKEEAMEKGIICDVVGTKPHIVDTGCCSFPVTQPSYTLSVESIKDMKRSIIFGSDSPNETELVIGDNFEIQVKDGKTYVVRKKSQYPKTYVECAKILDCFSASYIDGYKNDLLEKLQELLICRDAYWKIAGDWKPDFTNANDRKHCIVNTENKITKWVQKTTNKNLAFPTEEMRDAFYENFKDLIEECKELL